MKNNIREERLQGTYSFINENKDYMSILKVNYNNIDNIINDLEKCKKNVFVSFAKIDFTIEELKEMKKLYKRAINHLRYVNRKENYNARKF